VIDCAFCVFFVAIPKLNSNFAFEICGKLVTLYGTHLKGRAADRVAKKYKGRPTVEIV
jgi:RNase P/RNase MRP subunit p29